MSTQEFAVELGERKYGQIHAAGCRDLEDGEPVGTDILKAHEELWPESGPFATLEDAFKTSAPCAKALYKALQSA